MSDEERKDQEEEAAEKSGGEEEAAPEGDGEEGAEEELTDLELKSISGGALPRRYYGEGEAQGIGRRYFQE